MESDVIRTSGDSTVVDMWVGGKIRSVSVPRDAIDGFLAMGPDEAFAVSDEDCREFVRTHLSLVAAAAAERLKSLDPRAEAVTVDALLLRRHDRDRLGEPRSGRSMHRLDPPHA